MNFLNPAILWALPLASIPLVLHLIHQRPYRNFSYSCIKWLKEAHQSLMPRRKLRDILVLLARTFLLIFLVLFFARPVIQPGKIFSSQKEDESIVVLLDVSASMGGIDTGQPILEIAKEKTVSILRAIPTYTKIGFLAYSNKIEGEMAPTTERSRVINHIQESKVQPRSTNILPALVVASKMLANQTTARKTILIITDAARHGWVSALLSEGKWEGYDPGIPVVVWEVSRILENSSISDAFLQLDEEGVLKGIFEENQFGLKGKPNNWRLFLNGRVVDLGIIKNKRAASEKVPVTARLPEGGYYSGKLELDKDAFDFDDSFYIAGRISKGFRLLAVEGERSQAPADSETYYLKMALDSPRDPRLEAIQVISIDNFNPSLLQQNNAVVLANVGNVDSFAEEILDWVARGGGLFISGGEKWKDSLKVPLDVVRIKSLKTEDYSIAVPKAETFFFHRIVGLEDFEWKGTKVFKYFSLETPSSVNSLLNLDNGDPIMVARKIGKGNVIVLLTTLDRAWTNLPTKPVFSPMIREFIASLADPLTGMGSLMGFVDEPISFKVPASINHLTVMNPDGVSNSLRLQGSEFMHWSETSTPGLYQVTTDNKEIAFAFAINAKDLRLEGDTTRISTKELRQVFPRSPMHFIEHQKNNSQQVLAALEGRELAGLLIILIFICFFIETIFAWPRKKI